MPSARILTNLQSLYYVMKHYAVTASSCFHPGLCIYAQGGGGGGGWRGEKDRWGGGERRISRKQAGRDNERAADGGRFNHLAKHLTAVTHDVVDHDRRRRGFLDESTQWGMNHTPCLISHLYRAFSNQSRQRSTASGEFACRQWSVFTSHFHIDKCVRLILSFYGNVVRVTWNIIYKHAHLSIRQRTGQ